MRPRARADANSATVCSEISAGSDSARAAKIPKTSLPEAVVVSITAPSPVRTLSPMPRSVRLWTVYPGGAGPGLDDQVSTPIRCQQSSCPSSRKQVPTVRLSSLKRGPPRPSTKRPPRPGVHRAAGRCFANRRPWTPSCSRSAWHGPLVIYTNVYVTIEPYDSQP